ncbi:hypothetical protein HDU83_000508 [Entophlyctis luteolus]|nr:hypothetical protein HDU83_000508 [Entophlyctis luteolus]
MLEESQKEYDCEYIFTHDDDLVFRMRDNQSEKSVSEELISKLFHYQPAVAGFPWEFGDGYYSGMKSQVAFHAAHDVAPLTGFDSGMVLYHKSIVSFFIPYSPRGEGGFYGNWSLCAHFLTFFAPMTFRENAIRINTILYENTVTISKTNVNQRSKKKIDVNGNVVQSESRHPYEYKFNKPFEKFLTSGMHNPLLRFGRYITQLDIDWEVPSPATSAPTNEPNFPLKSFQNFDRFSVLKNISTFFDITHPILSNNVWLRKSFSDKELLDFRERQIRSPDDFEIVVNMFTTGKNVTRFLKFWNLFDTANKITRNVRIFVHIENEEWRNPDEFIGAVSQIRNLKSRHGPIQIFANIKRKGMLQTIIDSWFPCSRTEYGIMLFNDDLAVSTHILEYAEQTTLFYLQRNINEKRIFGVSLHLLEFSDSPNPETKTYLLQYPPIYGFIAAPEAWTRYVNWFHSLPYDFDPLLPQSNTNSWPKETNVSKFLLRHMVEVGSAMIVPVISGLPNGVIAPHGHELRRMNPAERQLQENWNLGGTDNDKLSLISLKRNISGLSYGIPGLAPAALMVTSKTLPGLKETSIFNYQFKKMEKLQDLNLGKQVRNMDKCTLVLFVQDRIRTLRKRIDYYQTHHLLESIVVIWNNPSNSTEQIPQLQDTNTTAMASLSVVTPAVFTPNNRFYPHKVIKSSCVVNLHEDFDIHASDLTEAIRLFQHSDYKGVVEVVDERRFSGGLRAGIFHMKHLKNYLALPAHIHSAVDAAGGCEDLAMSAVIASGGGRRIMMRVAHADMIDLGARDDAHFFVDAAVCGVVAVVAGESV